MQTCSWGNCPNEFPDHYISSVCGARHILVIGDDETVKVENLPLSGESYRYQVISPNDKEKIVKLAEKASAIVVFSTEETSLGETYPKKTLIIDTAKMAESMDRLQKFLLTSWKDRLI